MCVKGREGEREGGFPMTLHIPSSIPAGMQPGPPVTIQLTWGTQHCGQNASEYFTLSSVNAANVIWVKPLALQHHKHDATVKADCKAHTIDRNTHFTVLATYKLGNRFMLFSSLNKETYFCVRAEQRSLPCPPSHLSPPVSYPNCWRSCP